MIGAIVVIGYLAIAYFGYLHGERRFRSGLYFGRRLEAMEARHARERIIEQAHRCMADAIANEVEQTAHDARRMKGRP